jgi:hypothetical protein
VSARPAQLPRRAPADGAGCACSRRRWSGNAERCYILEILLRKRPRNQRRARRAGIGSLAMHYDPRRLPEERLLAGVDAVIGNLMAACPPARAARRPRRRRTARCRNARWPSKA